MKIISELTGKEYKSVKECEADEKKFAKEMEDMERAKAEAEKQLEEEKQAQLNKIEALGEEITKAESEISAMKKEYEEVLAKMRTGAMELRRERANLINDYTNKYGYYSKGDVKTFTNWDDFIDDLLSWGLF